jgi:hypothetical protein
MGWNRDDVAKALVPILQPIDAQAKVFPDPPETFNPPAFIVGFVQSVDYDLAAFGVDMVQLPIAACCGAGEVAKVDAYIVAARDAISEDLTLGGVVHAAKPRAQNNWRRLQVAGAEILAADLVLEIRM